MEKDKYSAVWVSHSSISDFLNCPRLYYLRNVYKDPKNNHKITIIKPQLALGQAIHDVIEEISFFPKEKRLDTPLLILIGKYWEKISGKKGGFISKLEEEEYRKRAVLMLERLEKNPGIILKEAVKLNKPGDLPFIWLSDKDNIILSGKIDWIHYLPNNTIHIVDFKTGKYEENSDSLQLPIYYLLASNLQKRKIAKISYWYLNFQNTPTKRNIPDIEKSKFQILEIARRMRLGRQINYFKCPKGGCFACLPFEKILKGEGEKVGESEYRQDIYFLP